MTKSLQFLLIAMMLAAFAGCSLFGSEEAEVIEREGPLVPLAVGNTWTFEQRGDEEGARRYTARLTEVREISGETYLQFLLNYGTSEETSQFFRDSTAAGARVGTISLFYVEERDYQESTFFAYPAEDGETYEYTDVRGLTFTYEVEAETVETPAGTFRAYTYSGYDADPQVSISFAPGVGPVRLTQTGSETVLVDYDLN